MSKKEQKKPNSSLPKSNVVDEIEKMKQKRDERRTKIEEIKKEKAEREAEHIVSLILKGLREELRC